MSDHYDVIIIGTGAEAARSPTGWRGRASASCCSSVAAICAASPRTGTRGLPQRAVPLQRAMDRPGRPAVPAPPAVLRRRQHEVLRRDPVPASRARFQRGHPLRRRLAGVADLILRSRALLRCRRGALPRPRRGRRGPDRAAAFGAVPLPGRLARTAHTGAPRRSREGRPPSVPSAGRRRPRRVRPGGWALRALRPLRRLSLPHRRQGRRARAVRAPGAQARQRHPADPRPRPATRDRRRGTSVSHRRRPQGRRGGLQRRHRRRLLRGGELSRAAAALGVGPPPQRARELLRPRRAQLHGPHQLGRDRDLPGRTPPSSRRRSASTTTTGAPTTPRRSATFRCSASPIAHPARWRAVVRAGDGARLHGPARDRLLDHDRGPAAP